MLFSAGGWPFKPPTSQRPCHATARWDQRARAGGGMGGGGARLEGKEKEAALPAHLLRRAREGGASFPHLHPTSSHPHSPRHGVPIDRRSTSLPLPSGARALSPPPLDRTHSTALPTRRAAALLPSSPTPAAGPAPSTSIYVDFGASRGPLGSWLAAVPSPGACLAPPVVTPCGGARSLAGPVTPPPAACTSPPRPPYAVAWSDASGEPGGGGRPRTSGSWGPDCLLAHDAPTPPPTAWRARAATSAPAALDVVEAPVLAPLSLPSQAKGVAATPPRAAARVPRARVPSSSHLGSWADRVFMYTADGRREAVGAAAREGRPRARARRPPRRCRRRRHPTPPPPPTGPPSEAAWWPPPCRRAPPPPPPRGGRRLRGGGRACARARGAASARRRHRLPPPASRAGGGGARSTCWWTTPAPATGPRRGRRRWRLGSGGCGMTRPSGACSTTAKSLETHTTPFPPPPLFPFITTGYLEANTAFSLLFF